MVGAGSRESCSDGAGTALTDGAAAGGGAEIAAAVGAGGGAGCSDGVAAGLADGAAAVDADGDADDGVGVTKDGAVGSVDTPVASGADRNGTSDCCTSLKGELFRLATSSRPTDRTTTDRTIQVALILTARSFCRPDKVVRRHLEHDEVEAE